MKAKFKFEKAPDGYKCTYCISDKELQQGDGCNSSVDINFEKPAGMTTFNCTRKRGHSGQHIACGQFHHEILTWVEDA